MRTVGAVLAALLVASLCAGPAQAGFRAADILQTVHDRVAAFTEAAVHKEGKPEKAIILVNYIVPPTVQEKFVDAFEVLQKVIEDKESGAIVFGLSKQVDTNLVYYLYSEFKTGVDYSKHESGEAFKLFTKEISDIGVVYKIHILKEVIPAKKPQADLLSAVNSFAAQPLAADKNDSGKVIILIDYTVPPAVQEKFVDAFEVVQESIDDEPGALVFGLTRPVDNNSIFYLYSEFKTGVDYSKHESNKVLKHFIKEISDIGVIYQSHILKQVTSFIHP